MNRREQVLALLAEVGLALDDDDIGGRLGINRHYVNTICRTLAVEGVVAREPGPDGKLHNRLVSPGPVGDGPPPAPRTSRSRLRRADRARRNVDNLIATFSECVDCFERSNAFAGPSLYFHERAIERRQAHADAASLLADTQFLETVYAVLPAWGMHRMGKQRAKVVDFDVMVESFRAMAESIQALWQRSITAIADDDVAEVSEQVWYIIAGLKVSQSETRIVAGSKALHHVLPDLVPPIDRQYTFQFFTGQKSVQHGDAAAFAEWFPYLCEIGRSCRPEIERITERAGFMATSPAKVIDNAIIGFMQSAGGSAAVASPTSDESTGGT
jgi:hypothetical protein